MKTRNDLDNDFWDWFNRARGDLSVRQVEERASVPRSRIGSSYSTRRKPTELVCLSIARGLGLPPEQVLLKAGLIDEAKSSLPPAQVLLKAGLIDKDNGLLVQTVAILGALRYEDLMCVAQFARWLRRGAP